MNSDRFFNTRVNKIVNSKILKELLLIVSPGLWMLLMGSSYARWNYSPFILFGSILIFCGYTRFGKIKGYKKPIWFPLYVGMILWSIFIFAGWVLDHRGMLALFSIIKDVVSIHFNQVFWLVASWGILSFLWHAFSLKSRGLWIYFSLHTCLLIVTIWYFYSADLVRQCTGVYTFLTNLPCSFSAALGPSGIFATAVILLLLPTVLALRSKQSLGNTSVIMILGIIPAWFELFFFPLQALGDSLLQSVRELAVNPQSWANMIDMIDRGSYAVIISFMICIPLGIKLMETERLKAAWVIAISNLTFILILVSYILGTKALEPVLPELLYTYYLVFGLFLCHLILTIITVIAWKPHLGG